jgi:acyl-CoA synthetase (AMP-forming)/AMP-acid ligase II
MLMRGYLGAPPVSRERPFLTGDLGDIDDQGRLLVLGRVDDVIITGGENVQPAEIERALSKCERVKASLCFGVPDARWGEIVAIALVLDRPESVVVARAALDDLAPFKRPRAFAIVDRLPLNASGKPDRRRARHDLGSLLELWPMANDRDTM